MKRILFVDDEPSILESIHRWLHPLRKMYSMEFASNGVDALMILETAPVDIIVSDIRMPHISGLELLEQVQLLYPQTVRIILSGFLQKNSSLRAAAAAHQFLPKPLDPDLLKATLLRAATISDLLQKSDLRRIVSRIRSLPSLPSLYLEIVQELENGNPSTERIGQIIAKDIAMTAKILQLVNSAFFGIPRTISDPGQAASLLGIETIRDLVLTINVFSQFDQGKLDKLGLNQLWDHSMNVGGYARRVAHSWTADRYQVSYALLGGMLHDIGILVLADNLTLDYYSALNLAARKNMELYQAESEIIGAGHEHVGAYLLALWNLAPEIVEAAHLHHQPNLCASTEKKALTAVHIANVLDHYVHHPASNLTAVPALNAEYLLRLNLSSSLEDWLPFTKN